MYSIDEIKARLANGEDLDTIAKEMEDVLNAAQAARDEEIAKAAITARDAAKRSDLANILYDIVAWLQEYYPDMCADVSKDLSAADKDELFVIVQDAILEALDKTADAVHNPRPMFNFGMDPMSMMLAAELLKGGNAPDKRPVAKATKTKSDDDILNEFLGKICH